MCITCCDCNAPIIRRTKKGRPPKRCNPCKKKKACCNAKAWADAHPEKIAARNKGPRHSHCVDCQRQISHAGTRGPLAKRCIPCHATHEQSLRNKNKIRHLHMCEHCGIEFFSGKKRQRCCSEACRAEWRKIDCKNRYHQATSQPCENPACKEPRKRGTEYCSRQCRHEHMRLPDAFCQNPACCKKIQRGPQGPRKTALGSDSRKYCCRECAWDHRWGADRPRKNWSKEHLASAAAGALQTSLRKKCKLLNVPNDEECTRRAVLDRDGWVCQMCRIECNREYIIDPKTRRIDPRNAEHDHIVPLTEQGSPGNVFPNSQCLCRKCNNKKRASSKGQLRLDLEGSVKRWESGARGRRRQNSRSSEAIPAAVL